MAKYLLLILFVSISSFSKEAIIIGLDADLSAVAKGGGIAIQRGAEIAINEINENGGVLGRPLELISRDHRGNPARGKHNIKALAKNPNLAAIIGGVHTPVVLQELELIHQNKIPFLIPWAAGTPIVDNGYEPNYVFRVSVRDAEAAQVLLKSAKEAGHKNIALLLEQTGWGRSNQKSMQKTSVDLGLNITYVGWFNWRQHSMKSELSRIKDSGATAILLVANAPEGATIVKEVASSDGFENMAIFSHWGIASGLFTDKVGVEALQQVDLSVLQTFSFLSPRNKTINDYVLASYKRNFDDTVTAETIPSAVGVAHAYDLVHLLANSITKANTLDKEVVRSYLEKTEPYSGLVKTYSPAFTKDKHDALLANDYFMATYNEQGYLVPKLNAKK